MFSILMKFSSSLFVSIAALAIAPIPTAAGEEPVVADAKPGKHLFILSGQSNMRQPLIATFAGTVEKIFGRDKVLVTSHGRPGQPILRWYRNWRPPEGVVKPEGGAKVYDELLGIVQRSIKGQKIESTTLVWMQGEEDARAGWENRYEESFFGVLDQLKTDLGLRDIKFVIGRINDSWLPSRDIVDGDMMRALQVKMAESNANGAWINSDDLNTGVNPWGIYEFDGGHFPNAGYRVMGQRFARAAGKLADPAAKLDESFFDAVFLDDAHKVKTHIGFEMPVTGPLPDAKCPGGKAGLSALVDGKLGTADFRSPEWLAFPPGEKNIEFIIDLGKPVDVSSVGINILIHHEASAHLPSKINLSISNNGSDYQDLGNGRNKDVSFDKHTRQLNLDKNFKPQSSFVLIENQTQAGRYVKVKITSDVSAKAWLFLDEIMVNSAIN